MKFRNTGWTDEARAAALAVRRAKAAARRATMAERDASDRARLKEERRVRREEMSDYSETAGGVPSPDTGGALGVGLSRGASDSSPGAYGGRGDGGASRVDRENRCDGEALGGVRKEEAVDGQASGGDGRGLEEARCRRA